MKFVNSICGSNPCVVNLERCNAVCVNINGAYAAINFYHGETDLTRWNYGHKDKESLDADLVMLCNAMHHLLPVPDRQSYADACAKLG